LVRVIRPGGELKVMLYNRRAVWACNLWVKQALLRGRPWKSVAWVLWHHMESPGTKGYTRGELLRLFATLPLERVHIRTEMTSPDYLAASAFPPLNWFWRCLLRLAGTREGWRPEDYVQRVNDPDYRLKRANGPRDPVRPLLTGNPLGFFHCITARKTR
jgi:hypothetical protein